MKRWCWSDIRYEDNNNNNKAEAEVIRESKHAAKPAQTPPKLCDDNSLKWKWKVDEKRNGGNYVKQHFSLHAQL